MNQSAIKSPLESSTNTNSVIFLENLVDQQSKICQLKHWIDWRYLDNELGHFFKYENAPPLRLIMGLLYLQSIDDLLYPEVISIWEESPEWQYFCGETLLAKTYPLPNASLDIWKRTIGQHGQLVMISALRTHSDFSLGSSEHH